jgi:phosphate/sulfate permease
MPLGPLNLNLNGNEEPKKASSIDRFFWTKGSKFYGYSGNPWQLTGGILGSTYAVVAVVFLILFNKVANFPVILPIIFGVLAAISLLMMRFFAKRSKKDIQPEVRISSNAKKLLYKIGHHIGWYDPDAWHGQYQANGAWNSWWKSVFGVKTASNVLNPQSAELLETGCSEYNRITGLLKLAKDSKGRPSNLVPQIQAASDEAMISLLNQVALLEDNPETHSAILSHCNSQIAKLKELAERYEEMLSGPMTIADRLSSTTVMDNVLDQLRLEAQAHEELRIMDRMDQ